MENKWKELKITLTTATLDGWYGLLLGMNRKSKERYVLIKQKDLERILKHLTSKGEEK